MTDDARDLTAALAGDHEAFARLYDRHAAVVLSLCRCRSAGDADDAVQETFLRAYRLLPQLDAPEKLRPWLYAITRRVCAERRRSANRRNHHEERAMMIRAMEPPKTSPSIDAAEKSEQLDRLTAAIGTLPDDERLAVHLFYLEEDAANTAATTLGLSRSAFYKLLARARQKLSRQMREVPSR